MRTNRLAVLYRQNLQKLFMFSIMIMKKVYRLLLLTLLKFFKRASI